MKIQTRQYSVIIQSKECIIGVPNTFSKNVVDFGFYFIYRICVYFLSFKEKCFTVF